MHMDIKWSFFPICPWRPCFSVGFRNWGTIEESSSLCLGNPITFKSFLPFVSRSRWSPTSSPSTAWSVCFWAFPSRCGSPFFWCSSSFPQSSACPSGSAGCIWSRWSSFLRWVIQFTMIISWLNYWTISGAVESSTGFVCSVNISEYILEGHSWSLLVGFTLLSSVFSTLSLHWGC